MTDYPIRLNKFLATQTGLSRRAADEAIEKGSVTINGVPAIIGNQVKSDDIVALDGATIDHASARLVITVHKPVNYVSSRRQQGESPTLYDLLPPEYQALKLVGRLDRDSSGLILLTNDGDFAHQMTHPSFRKRKIYQVTLDQPLQPLHRQMISDFGLMLEDGKSQFELDRLIDGDDTQWIVTMHEGRNRQIRRTFAALGYTVTSLHRTEFGPYTLGDLTPGMWRPV